MMMVKGKKLEWKQIKNEMKQSDFIKKILKFNVKKVKESVKRKIKSDYLDND